MSLVLTIGSYKSNYHIDTTTTVSLRNSLQYNTDINLRTKVIMTCTNRSTANFAGMAIVKSSTKVPLFLLIQQNTLSSDNIHYLYQLTNHLDI
jgi:hypothetical protein